MIVDVFYVYYVYPSNYLNDIFMSIVNYVVSCKPIWKNANIKALWLLYFPDQTESANGSIHTILIHRYLYTPILVC